MKNKIAILLMILFIASCKSKDNDRDAFGIFESDEIIVSSEVAGKVVALNFTEGQFLTASKKLTVPIKLVSKL